MEALLKEAKLETHGYKKVTITKLTQKPGSKIPEYSKEVHYHKTVKCNKVNEVESELDRLLKGKLKFKNCKQDSSILISSLHSRSPN